MKSRGKYVNVCRFFLMALLLTGCGVYEENEIQEDLPIVEENELLFITELDRKTEITDAEYIDVSQSETDVVIEDGGEYVLSGNSHQTITVDAHDQIIHLFLDGITVETAIGPAINIESAGKVVITLIEGSENTFSDAAYYYDSELNAAISAPCDLTINGSGSLLVSGYYKDAIHTKDVFKLLGGQVHLRAKRYGIKGNDGMVLAPNTLLIESEKNGCQTSNANNPEKGIIDVRSGEIEIIAGEYALSAESDVYIQNGSINLNSVMGNIFTKGQQYVADGVVVNE